MTKFFHIALEEMMVHLREWTFYLTAVGMPLVFAAIGLLPQLRAMTEQSPLARVETVFSDTETLTEWTGYVDEAGLVKVVPESLAENLRAYRSQATAAQALEGGEIARYYVIATDFERSGAVTAYSANPELLSGGDGVIRSLIRANILAQIEDANLAARLDDPVRFDRGGRPAPPAFRFIPADLDRQTLTAAAMVIGLFAYIINVGGFLVVRALRREMNSKILEMMITSASPGQFIGGKLAGLAGLSLGQATVTLLAGALVYSRSPGEAGTGVLPLAAIALMLPYLLLGFLAYCGAMMSIPAIWPSLSESTTLLAMVRLVALAPLIGVVFILPNPDSPASVLLSINPWSGPLLMPFRLLLTDVPAWQWAGGLLGLLAWAGFSIWFSARLFRLNTLLTGRSLSVRVVWQAVAR
jgi:ABC-2 type transport system permease protein